MANETTGLELRSTLRKDAVLEVRLTRVPVPSPGDDEVVVRVEASPINPSDLGVMFAWADVEAAKAEGSGEDSVVRIPVPAATVAAMPARVDQGLTVGNEGAGVVVAAGSSPRAQALLGKTVALFAGGMYTQFRKAKAAQCLALAPGTTPADGASAFVNPLTALGMVETLRAERHTALVHTAAASNLGQMLVRLCLADSIGLVNVVRSAEQARLLKELGAKHVVDSTTAGFRDALTDALAETGATLAFDAIGGGRIASEILAAMERAAARSASGYSHYGSTAHKQVYVYGGLDRGPTELSRSYGMAWGVGGWLLPNFLQKIGPAAGERLRQRVAAEIKTTFASQYAHEVSLVGMLRLDEIATYAKKATGLKVLVRPHG